VALPLHQGAGLTIGPQETGGIKNPAVDQLLQPPLGGVVEHSGASEGMQVAIGVEPQLGGAVVPVCQFLAGIAKRLEVADGVGMLESGHEQGWPVTHFGAPARELCARDCPKNRTLEGGRGDAKANKSVKMESTNGLIETQIKTSMAQPSEFDYGGHARRILVADPHATLRTVLAQRLRQDGHLAAAVGSAQEALEVCQGQAPHLLVSAELLEETSALRLAAQLHCPVMVLTARSGSEPVVSLLDAGADDVLRKPFGLEELAARCRTLLRRSGTGLQERVCVGPLEVHLLLRQVTLRDQPVELSPREFALLCALLMPPGVVRTRQELLRMAWPPFSGGPRSVDTQVLTLRRKLEQAGLGEGGGIETMRQQGYRFSLDILPETEEVMPTKGSVLLPQTNGTRIA
jgi:two-component system OmpR family response regulator